MAPIDLRLGQNAFQVIPKLSFFDIEDGKIFGFFGLDHLSWPWTHVDTCVLVQDTCVVAHDTCVLGQDTCVLGQNTCVLARTHVSRPGQTDRDQKIRKFIRLRCQKMKVRGSPETRFGQVSGQSEPSSGGKRTVKVWENFEKNCFRRRKMKRRESPETRFGKVSSQSEPSSGGKRPFEV